MKLLKIFKSNTVLVYCILFLYPFKDLNILKPKRKKNAETEDTDVDPLAYYNMIKKQKEKKKEHIKEER